MVAIRYHRVSTSDQADSALGLEAQREATDALCRYKGWTALYSLDDVATGANTDRQALQNALRLLADGEAQVLVTAKIDRLSRSVADWLNLADRAAREGWHIAIRDLDLDTTAPHGRLILTIMSALAQWEREIISLRTREALAAKRADGYRLGAPLGLSADVQVMIRKHYATGLHSFEDLAERLASSGDVHATPRVQRWRKKLAKLISDGMSPDEAVAKLGPEPQNRWHTSTLRRICRGLVVRRGRLVAGDPESLDPLA